MYVETKTEVLSIEDYMAPYVPFFSRSEAVELAQSYVVGLTLDGERKSVEPMSAKVHASERGMQRLLTEVKWDHEGVIRCYRQRMLAETNDPLGVLAVDDTAFPKKGQHSVCVARQYCGSLGKVDNCQVGVSLTYVGQGIAWPYVMDLFVPKTWDDPEDPRCAVMREKTRMPYTAHHQAKWQIALQQIDLARKDGALHRAVVADTSYGTVTEFRKELDDRQEGYVVGIQGATEVFLETPVFVEPPLKHRKRGRPAKRPKLIETNPRPVKVSELGAQVQGGQWEHLELRRNNKGKPLIVEAISLRVWPSQGYRKGIRHEEVWLIIERRTKATEYELRYFFSNMPQDMPTLEMVRLYHERYWIEQGYQQLKEELGLDHHEGRSWTGWHRHVLLVFLAFGYLSLLRIQEKKQAERALWKKV